MSVWWLALLLTSASPNEGAPISVSILSQQAPTRLSANTKVASCDNVTVSGSQVELVAQDNRIRLGALVCEVVTLRGPVLLTVDALSRRYTGLVTLHSHRGHLQAVHTVDVETYLVGVVEGEMDNAPPAAIRAQAVVSRTFAAAAQLSPRHADAQVCDLTHCQLYRGETLNPSGSVADAVNATFTLATSPCCQRIFTPPAEGIPVLRRPYLVDSGPALVSLT
jgi:peptidoglycan hydrolase-like amidase